MTDYSNYYRIPGYQLRLPSGGRYNEFTKSSTNDVEILPFTTKDELYLANPDSLLNGSALENVMTSCISNFDGDVKHIPMIDVEAILLAAKLSTYGDDLNLTAICPECGNEVKFSISISGLLERIKYLPDNLYVETSNKLRFYLKPMSLGDSTEIQLSEFAEASNIKNILDDSLSLEKRSILLKPTIGRMVNTAIDIMCFGIEKIVILDKDIEITDREQIKLFVSNMPSNFTKEIRENQTKISECGVSKKTEVLCNNCKHQWENNISLDPSSFFE